MRTSWKKKRLELLTAEVLGYLEKTYEAQRPVHFSQFGLDADTESGRDTEVPNQSGIKFSLREPLYSDKYDTDRIATLLRSRDDIGSGALTRELGQSINKSFTEKLIDLINEKGLRDTDVYKAAQMDRRLFSKIMSDREFKPSKDTALALVFALRLSLPEAADLLSRAGYSLSHSSKRDVILEFFIREGIYDLTDINAVLDNLEQKIIGR